MNSTHFRSVCLFALIITGQIAFGGQSMPATSALNAAMVGRWTGVLQYRDYSEPPSSPKRVQLPTWLTIETLPNGTQRWRYIYDDGPDKVLEEAELVAFDPKARTYVITAKDRTATYDVSGFESIKNGRGELTITGKTSENGKPVDQRITLRVFRNLITVLDETRPAGTNESYAFRHSYTFTRADAPPKTAGL